MKRQWLKWNKGTRASMRAAEPASMRLPAGKAELPLHVNMPVSPEPVDQPGLVLKMAAHAEKPSETHVYADICFSCFEEQVVSEDAPNLRRRSG
jgi:hypothetical protein